MAIKRFPGSAEDDVVPIDLSFEAASSGQQQLRVVVGYVDENNKLAAQDDRILTLNVRDEPLPVLLVADSYSYEVRFLRHYLERTLQRTGNGAKVFAPTYCIASTERKLVQSDDRFVSFLPADQNWWNQFEACIFLDPKQEMFDRSVWNSVTTAVEEKGVGLIFVAGLSNADSFSQQPHLLRLLPVDEVNVIRVKRCTSPSSLKPNFSELV